MKKYLKIAAGVALSAFLLWFLFRETDWAEVGAAFRAAHWGLVALAGLAIVVTFFTRAQRWGYIVRTAKPVAYPQLFHATQIGFLANFILPLRAGEAIRALVLSLKTDIAFTRCLAFVALDRITDVLTLMLVLIVAMLAFQPAAPLQLPPEVYSQPIPPNVIQQGALVTAVLALGMMVGLALLYFQQRLVLRLVYRTLRLVSQTLAEWVDGWLLHFSEGLKILKRPSAMLLAMLWSLPTWAGGMVAMALLLRAFNIDFPWYAPILVQAFLAIAISAPGAPGFVGQFHFGVALGLYASVPAIGAGAVGAIAILYHLLNLVTVGAVGAVSLHYEGIGLMTLRRRSEAATEGLEQELEEEVHHEFEPESPRGQT